MQEVGHDVGSVRALSIKTVRSRDAAKLRLKGGIGSHPAAPLRSIVLDSYMTTSAYALPHYLRTRHTVVHKSTKFIGTEVPSLFSAVDIPISQVGF
jgi:hypothetical protein